MIIVSGLEVIGISVHIGCISNILRGTRNLSFLTYIKCIIFLFYL